MYERIISGFGKKKAMDKAITAPIRNEEVAIL
jgi:hypothetical protein